jgi:hypothetical protein
MSASTSLRRSFGSASAMVDTFLNAPELAKLTIELLFIARHVGRRQHAAH